MNQPKLWQAILLDLIGLASFFIPPFFEYIDILWAPLSAFLFYKMYGGRFGTFGAILNFIEEASPFTDFFPTFTIAWMIKYFQNKKKR